MRTLEELTIEIDSICSEIGVLSMTVEPGSEIRPSNEVLYMALYGIREHLNRINGDLVVISA